MVIVYTAILGGCDSLKPAPKGADRCVCISNDTSHLKATNGWSIAWLEDVSTYQVGVDPTEKPWLHNDPRRLAWWMRCIPNQVLPGLIHVQYDTVVWVDASFTVTDLPKLLRDSAGHELSALRHHKRHSCYDEGVEVVKNGQSDAADVSEQLSGYRREGFNPYELSISCILVRQNTQKVTAFNELWDAEIQKHPGDNTQLSIDYCAWKTGVGVHHLQGVRKDNPYAVHDHADHKRRRKPYR